MSKQSAKEALLSTLNGDPQTSSAPESSESAPASVEASVEQNSQEDVATVTPTNEETQQEQTIEAAHQYQSAFDAVEGILASADSVDMVLTTGAGQKAAWLIVADLVPVASVKWEDQEDSVTADYFQCTDYRDSVIEGAKALGFAKVLGGMKASIISEGKVLEAPKYNIDEGKLRAALSKEFGENAAHALQAMNKNFYEHPLKIAFFDVLSEMGVPNPEFAVDAAFAQGGEEFGKSLISNTENLLNLDPNAREQLVATFGRMNAPQVSSNEEGGLKASLEMNSVHLFAPRSQEQRVQDRVRSSLNLK